MAYVIVIYAFIFDMLIFQIEVTPLQIAGIGLVVNVTIAMALHKLSA